MWPRGAGFSKKLAAALSTRDADYQAIRIARIVSHLVARGPAHSPKAATVYCKG
jgi:hypothetical protein